MFIRTKTFKNKDGSQRAYVQIVESIRTQGKIRQKVIANIGRMEDATHEKIERLVDSLEKFIGREKVALQDERLMVRQAKEWGVDLIFRNLWEKLGIDKILKQFIKKAETEIPIEEAIYAMILNRISDPLSKRGTSDWISEVYRSGFEELELHHFYRALDFLIQHKDEIEQLLFSKAVDVLSLKLDIVFWDTTSVYLEGNSYEGIAEYGYSKDHRPDKVQVVVGILMTGEGIPVAHEIYPGNISDKKTFTSIIKKVRERFSLRRVIFVADRGMVSTEILKELEKEKIEYIVGIRMRKMKLTEQVLRRAGAYRGVADNLRVKEVHYLGDRYIVCFNPEEANREKQVRQQLVENLEEVLHQRGVKSLIGNSLYKRFLKMKTASAEVDYDKLRTEEKYDGKYVLKTNSNLPASDAALAYKQLWRIEQAFKELKTTLEIRPIYHWKDRRIKAHIFICFLALLLEFTFYKSMKDAGIKQDYIYLMRDLKKLKAVEIELDGNVYLCRNELVGRAYDVFKALGIRPPNHISLLQ
ncbi:MAG: transposase [Candidatus Fischerbacteria bacterium RBG_13_37_8]|uniref:Transposase n=1 Tax=Candidatus Fischerbacteria bacterium RBG_13_37_8 TaxID=1817863 RepID=A0A1F5VJX5_9BACT|nr:MAG: transposase [Candidatus Fischerbacteria bacterium RBG_13_37_8]